MDKNTIKLFGSRKSDHWQTPPDIYNKLNEEFNFDFDPCPLNAQVDAMSIPWGKKNFVNPPYSKVKMFLNKAEYELSYGNSELCVFLVFANTDTQWFHRFIYNKENIEIRFLPKRIKFLDMNGVQQNSAMRPSMLVIMKRGNDE